MTASLTPHHIEAMQICAFEATCPSRMRHEGVGCTAVRVCRELVALGFLRPLAGARGPRDGRVLYVTTLAGREELRRRGHSVSGSGAKRELLPSERAAAAQEIRARNAARVAHIIAQRAEGSRWRG